MKCQFYDADCLEVRGMELTEQFFKTFTVRTDIYIDLRFSQR
jgi:hypothetical protein